MPDLTGPPYTIRTCDLRLRRPLLYPTELRAVAKEENHGKRRALHCGRLPETADSHEKRPATNSAKNQASNYTRSLRGSDRKRQLQIKPAARGT